MMRPNIFIEKKIFVNLNQTVLTDISIPAPSFLSSLRLGRKKNISKFILQVRWGSRKLIILIKKPKHIVFNRNNFNFPPEAKTNIFCTDR